MNEGRWTDEEHARFREGVMLHGKEWKMVTDYVGTRSLVQVRTHAQKYFSKLEKNFTKLGHKAPSALAGTSVKNTEDLVALRQVIEEDIRYSADANKSDVDGDELDSGYEPNCPQNDQVSHRPASRASGQKISASRKSGPRLESSFKRKKRAKGEKSDNKLRNNSRKNFVSPGTLSGISNKEESIHTYTMPEGSVNVMQPDFRSSRFAYNFLRSLEGDTHLGNNNAGNSELYVTENSQEHYPCGSYNGSGQMMANLSSYGFQEDLQVQPVPSFFSDSNFHPMQTPGSEDFNSDLEGLAGSHNDQSSSISFRECVHDDEFHYFPTLCDVDPHDCFADEEENDFHMDGQLLSEFQTESSYF